MFEWLDVLKSAGGRFRIPERLLLILQLLIIVTVLFGSWALLEPASQGALLEGTLGNLWFRVCALVAVIVGGLLPKKPKGKIESPLSGPVSRQMQVTGWTKGIPRRSRVWLVVEHGNLRWPKDPPVQSNCRFQVDIHEGGKPPDGKFTLSLFLVRLAIHEKLLEWIRGGVFDGFPEIEGTRLDSAPLRLQ